MGERKGKKEGERGGKRKIKIKDVNKEAQYINKGTKVTLYIVHC